MLELLQMWALVEVLGLLCLPLTITVCHNLPDRGWAFSKAIGMALLAFGVWLPLMLWHALPFSQLFIAGMLLLFCASMLFSFLRTRHTLTKIMRVNMSYIVITELVFLGMVFLMGWIRSYGPEIRSYEMYMDEGFIASIMRSPHFPPSDMWYAGQSINYYYYAHFTIAVLAKLLGQSPSIAFNTGICIFFGLTAINMFGVTCNIIAWARHLRTRSNESEERPDSVFPPLLKAVPYGLMTFVFGLILGNLAATQDWWKTHGDHLPYDWFQPSRVIDKTINEFPAFSFLLSCFHAHVLTLAFTILAMGLAFNLFLEREGKGLFVFGRSWRLPLTMGITALILGGLFTMNGWDFPTYVGLAIVCIALQQWEAYQRTFRFELVLDVFTAAASLTALSFILYAPFYLNFVSPSQGLGLVGPADRSQLRDELLIYGMFAFLFLSLLAVSITKRRAIAGTQDNDVADRSSGSTRRWFSASVIALLTGLVVALVVLVLLKNSTTFVVAASITAIGTVLVFYTLRDRSQAFTLLLGTVAFALIAGCEILFLKDVFADSYPRMNTVFKFYFQAWALLSVTSGAGLYFILERFFSLKQETSGQVWVQRGTQVIWSAGFLILVLASAVYPLAAFYPRFALIDFSSKYQQHYYLQRTNSLDGLSYLATDSSNPGDYAAIRWLNANVQDNPVIVEAIGPDYSNFARISAFTGLPTIMGWVGHEYQWRVNWLNRSGNMLDFNRRSNDVDTIYTNPDPRTVLSVMATYQAQYLYVGPLEYQKYPTINLHRFSTFMQVVYNANGVTIYKVRANAG